jgi:ABC-type branched-subunit amino acid transport system ATPase component
MSLEIQDLTLKFGGLTALNRVGLKADDRELVAIVGPNGAGKTALLNCINGVYRPLAGRIVLDGRDITAIPADRIARARWPRIPARRAVPAYDGDREFAARPTHSDAYRGSLGERLFRSRT